MSKKFYPHNVLVQAQETLIGWKQIDSTQPFGTISAAALSADIETASEIKAEIDALEAQLTAKRNQRDEVHLLMWGKLKRVRLGVKANYGDDSSEYELVGGTRASDRKSFTRKAVS